MIAEVLARRSTEERMTDGKQYYMNLLNFKSHELCRFERFARIKVWRTFASLTTHTHLLANKYSVDDFWFVYQSKLMLENMKKNVLEIDKVTWIEFKKIFNVDLMSKNLFNVRNEKVLEFYMRYRGEMPTRAVNPDFPETVCIVNCFEKGLSEDAIGFFKHMRCIRIINHNKGKKFPISLDWFKTTSSNIKKGIALEGFHVQLFDKLKWADCSKNLYFKNCEFDEGVLDELISAKGVHLNIE